MDRVTLQPGAGSAAIYANVVDDPRLPRRRAATAAARDEVITTIFSHPSNAACAKVGRLQGHHPLPGRRRLPRPRGAQGGRLGADRRAADHQPRGHRASSTRDIDEFVRVVHEAGGLCATTRPTPTASWASPAPATPASTCATSTCTRRSRRRTAAAGPAAGACGVTDGAGALPAAARRSSSTATAIVLDDDRPQSIGKVRPWYGVDAEPRAGLRLDHEPGRRGPARGGRDRGAQQQLPACSRCSRSAASSAPYAAGQAPHRAGALQLGAARRGDRRPLGGDRRPRGRLRHALLDQPPSLRGARADDARADRVVLAGRPRRVRRDPGARSPTRRTRTPDSRPRRPTAARSTRSTTSRSTTRRAGP